MTDSGRAVFLSYASQDAEAAQRVCNALRAAGVEVWFDQSELRGGDVWDQKIRREIHDCALFIPVISANTASRHEGYFRLEWDLADQRTHMLARNRAFIVPVCLDATPDAGADVPESFQRVQWTRLPRGETPPEFVRRIEQLLSGEVRPATMAARGPAGVASGRSSRRAWLAVGVAVLIAAVSAYLIVEKPWIAKPRPPAAFAPPPHSIAVLPFVNLSGDKEQEYFSDGLTDEILNSLSTIEGLQVVARTSSFSFKGKDTDIGVIAHRLNVGAVLEGSIRRSDHSIRVTAQLIDAMTGYHLWSKTYDEESGDVLKLQTEIATAVAQALRVTLQGDAYEKITLGGTNNLVAFDALQRALKAYRRAATGDAKAFQDAIDASTDAIRLDPNYARAFTARARFYLNPPPLLPEKLREFNKKALADARQAIAIAPSYAGSHAALASYFENAALDFARADEEFERARVLLEPTVCIECARFAIFMGHFEPGLVALRRAVALNPLSLDIHAALTEGLYYSRQYQDSVAAAKQDISAQPDQQIPYALLGFSYLGLGDYEHARTTCEAKPDYWECQQCLAITYEKLGRHTEAEAALAKLDALGDDAAYQNAAVYAQWGNVPKALEWLDTAMRLRDSALVYLKTDPLMEPLRKEPRFQAIERELNFPN